MLLLINVLFQNLQYSVTNFYFYIFNVLLVESRVVENNNFFLLHPDRVFYLPGGHNIITV